MLSFEVPHSLSKDEARQRMERLIGYWGTKYGVKAQWAGDQATLSGKVMGITLNATLQVGDQKVGGEASDPGLLFRGQAKKYLTHKFTHYLDPKKQLAELGRESD
jgi:hypothetical protein